MTAKAGPGPRSASGARTRKAAHPADGSSASSQARRIAAPLDRAKRVLVVYKKSAYERHARERGHRGLNALIAAGGAPAERLMRAHHDHAATVEVARTALRKLGAKAKFQHRGATRAEAEFDLVLTLGGDGTVLRASHGVGTECPLLGINTAPRDSLGHYCAATADDLEDILADALAGRLRETEVARMQVEIDGHVLSTRVLNDVLFCHASPAATTRYTLRVGGREETHKSSGVWVATAAGSTAAIQSAGGKKQRIDDQRLQYVVREPFMVGRPRPRLLHGYVSPKGALSLGSHIRDGRLFLDGPHLATAIEIGAWMRMSRSREPLRLLGFRSR